MNSFGTIGYAGPCPQTGHLHRYDFKVYGIDTNLNLAAGSGKDELVKAMTGHVVQYGDVSVQYGR